MCLPDTNTFLAIINNTTVEKGFLLISVMSML